MKNDLSNVKVGDWIFAIPVGWVKVEGIIYNNNFPIEAGDETYTLDGKIMPCDKYPSAFTEPPECFNAEPKPCEFVKGQRVLVNDQGEHHPWFKRYFSHMGSYGQYFCFRNGQTEWSSSGEVSRWKYCIPAEEE